MEQAMEVVDLARTSLNPDLELLGVCLNIANMRTKHARQTQEALSERSGVSPRTSDGSVPIFDMGTILLGYVRSPGPVP